MTTIRKEAKSDKQKKKKAFFSLVLLDGILLAVLDVRSCSELLVNSVRSALNDFRNVLVNEPNQLVKQVTRRAMSGFVIAHTQ